MTQKPRPPADGSRSYEVGYARPPKHSQFRKGESGNPSGRPKHAQRLGSILNTELGTPVDFRIGGKRCNISKREAIVRRHLENAMCGDIRALEFFLRHIRKTEPAEPRCIIRIYKDGEENVELSRGDVGVSRRYDTASSPSTMDSTNVAVPPHTASERTSSNGSGSAQLMRDASRAGESNSMVSSGKDCTRTAVEAPTRTPPPDSCISPGVEATAWTGRMRAPRPYADYYMRDRRYRADGHGIIEGVSPEDRYRLCEYGCVDV